MNDKFFDEIIKRNNRIILILDKNLKIIWACEEALKKSKSTKKNTIGNSCYNLFHNRKTPCKFKDNICPAKKTLKKNEPFNVIHNYNKNGKNYHFEISTYPILDKKGKVSKIIYLSDDITDSINENKRSNNSAEASLRNVIEKNSDAMIVINKDRIIKFVNDAAEIFLGQKKDKLVGDKFQLSAAKGKKSEINIQLNNSKIITADIKESNIIWEGEPAFLASIRDITEQVQLRETLKSMALVDDLTGLYNKRGFLTLADQQRKLSIRTKREMFVLYIDIDRLKNINNTFGHHEGDKVLTDIADILKNTFRESDIISRIGEDEFTVLAIEASNKCYEILASRLEKNLELKNEEKNRKFEISISFGISHFNPFHPSSIEDLMSRADKFMYLQKQKKNIIS